MRRHGRLVRSSEKSGGSHRRLAASHPGALVKLLSCGLIFFGVQACATSDAPSEPLDSLAPPVRLTAGGRVRNFPHTPRPDHFLVMLPVTAEGANGTTIVEVSAPSGTHLENAWVLEPDGPIPRATGSDYDPGDQFLLPAGVPSGEPMMLVIEYRIFSCDQAELGGFFRIDTEGPSPQLRNSQVFPDEATGAKAGQTAAIGLDCQN